MASAVQGQTLAQLASALGQGQPGTTLCHAKVFSCLRHDPESVVRALAELGDQGPRGQNAAVALVAIDISKLNLVEAKAILFEKDERLVVWMDLRDRKLPEAKFLMVTARATRTGSETSYATALTMINRVRAILSARYGTLAFFREVVTFDFDSDGKTHYGSDLVRMPMESEFLFFPAPFPDKLANDILSSSALNSGRDRAISFLAKAFDEQDEIFRFTAYWIALEVLCGGSAGTIRARLARAYGIRPVQSVDSVLRFSDIADLRHGLLHKGTFKSFRPYQERLMIAYFWGLFFASEGHPIDRLAEGLIRTDSVGREIEEFEKSHSIASRHSSKAD